MSSFISKTNKIASQQLVRKRPAPPDFDQVNNRRFPDHPALYKRETGKSIDIDDPDAPLTAYGDPAFVSFNHRKPAPAVEEIVRDQAAPDNRPDFMCRLAGIMMSSVLAGLSGIGRRITHFFYNDPSYNIVERHHYDPRSGSWSNKRAKIQGVRENLLADEPPSFGIPNPAFFNDDEGIEEVFEQGMHYYNVFRIFQRALSEYLWYDVERDRVGEQHIIEQLKWIETGLFDSPEEVRPLHDIVTQGSSSTIPKPNHWTKFKLILMQVETFLCHLYDFENLQDASYYNAARVSHDYCHLAGKNDNEIDGFIRHGTATKKLLSNEHFVALIIWLNRALNIPPPDRITQEMIKKILLDISAIENNLPPPTFIKGTEAQTLYRYEVAKTFKPIPRWMDLPLTDLNPLKSENLPGTFPWEPEHSSLYSYPNGRIKRVTNASQLPLPPPLAKKSGRGELVSPSKSDDMEPIWHPINAGRVDKPLKRCKRCKNLPRRCMLSGCKETASRLFRLQQQLSSEQLHSPHHRVAPKPLPILKRSTNRHQPVQLIDILKETGDRVKFSESTIDPPSLASTNNTVSQDFEHQLNNIFSQAFPTDYTQVPSAEAQEAIAQAHEQARKEHEELLARQREEKLALTGGLRPPNMNLVEDLPENVMQRVTATLNAAPPTTLATTGEGVELRSRDFGKVVPASEWLNDEIVNGALNWLDKSVNSAAGVKNPRTQTRKCAAFSSFYFKMLRDSGAKKGVRTLGRMGIKRQNFHQVETLLLPVCENSHWTLVVVRPSKKTVAHMDSLNPRGNSQFINVIYELLKEFLQEDFVPKDWKTVQHEAPRQTNGWDCGVHTITNAMCLALGLNPIESYTAKDMRMQRLRVAGMLLNGGFHGDYSLQAF